MRRIDRELDHLHNRHYERGYQESQLGLVVVNMTGTISLCRSYENVRAVKYDDLTAFDPVASLAGPFSEAILVQ